MNRLTGILLVCVLGAHCGATPVAPSEEPPLVTPSVPAPPPTLLQQVVAGGFVVFFRHTPRDAEAMSTEALAIADNRGDCLPGSQLTTAGEADAVALGAAFTRLGVQVDRVLTSPACRTTQMARLAFERFETTRALTWPGMWTEEERSTLTPMLRGLLATPPRSGATVVLISHSDVLRTDRVGVAVTLDQGDAAVFRPLGPDAFELMGKITKQEWLDAR